MPVQTTFQICTQHDNLNAHVNLLLTSRSSTATLVWQYCKTCYQPPPNQLRKKNCFFKARQKSKVRNQRRKHLVIDCFIYKKGILITLEERKASVQTKLLQVPLCLHIITFSFSFLHSYFMFSSRTNSSNNNSAKTYVSSVFNTINNRAVQMFIMVSLQP